MLVDLKVSYESGTPSIPVRARLLLFLLLIFLLLLVLVDLKVS